MELPPYPETKTRPQPRKNKTAAIISSREGHELNGPIAFPLTGGSDKARLTLSRWSQHPTGPFERQRSALGPVECSLSAGSRARGQVKARLPRGVAKIDIFVLVGRILAAHEVAQFLRACVNRCRFGWSTASGTWCPGAALEAYAAARPLPGEN